jgi:hypothetical protein
MTVTDTDIVRAAIYPAIGIARVGNSPEEFFIGPEVTEPIAHSPGFYRDTSGALKRQAARFRIYGLNAAGVPVAELTAANATIGWTVHLANKKAAWYEFQLAQDIPEAAAAPPQWLRNGEIADRSTLTIDPGPRSIAPGGAPQRFDTGKFMGTTVYIGELQCGADGRLIVLGGHGKSASYNGAKAITFANNEGWHDDTGDGPVLASVTYQGKALPVDPAWVVVAPPNYGPMQKSVRTMWDLMRDVAINAGLLEAPPIPSFNSDIRPILQRLTDLQWVNAGFAGGFGWGSGNDFSDPAFLSQLNNTGDAGKLLRNAIANCFRQFDRDAWSPVPWPWVYGDAMNVPTPPTPRAFTELTGTQLTMLGQWAAGHFVGDYDPKAVPPASIDEVPVAEQPDMLIRAAMEFCLADAFHPGCEMTWPMRQASMYAAAFRLNQAPLGWVEPDYGPVFTPAMLNSPIFGGQVPGGISRWMAVPWQTDTASCLSGYNPGSFGPYLPTFWPARVPNQALTPPDYAIVMDGSAKVEDRMAAFARRAQWNKQLTVQGNYVVQINSMVADIAQMGVVEQLPGPSDTAAFPAFIQVEDRWAHPTLKASAAHHAEDAPSGIAKVRRFARGLPRG